MTNSPSVENVTFVRRLQTMVASKSVSVSRNVVFVCFEFADENSRPSASCFVLHSTSDVVDVSRLSAEACFASNFVFEKAPFQDFDFEKKAAIVDFGPCYEC